MPRIKRVPKTMLYDALIRFLQQPFTIAWMELIEDEDKLDETFQAWCLYTNHARAIYVFIEAVEQLFDKECSICHDCRTAHWDCEITLTASEDAVCDACIQDYSQCDYCCSYVSYRSPVDADSYYCESCVSDRTSYCEECDRYYTNDYADDHRHGGCECEAPHRHFKFPADGHGLITEDERLTVELPKGTIDDEGIRRIKRLLYQVSTDWHLVETVVDSVGTLWQAKRGNFTRRLAAAFHKYEIKLPAGLISEIGNLARAHSSDEAAWYIELTRDLNLSADEFCNEESCWWTGYTYARCSLKNWGGLGLRTFFTEDGYSVTGRAWVQPLNKDLKPTHDAENAHAYIVYNGYGDMEGYVAARIIAHLTSRSYCKIVFGADRQYVNSESGYLIADEDTCEATDRIWFFGDEHDQRDAQTFSEETAAA